MPEFCAYEWGGRVPQTAQTTSFSSRSTLIRSMPSPRTLQVPPGSSASRRSRANE